MVDYWASPVHQKQHFDEYARNNNFDPLIPENWYPITFRMVTPAKVFYYYFYAFFFCLAVLFSFNVKIADYKTNN
jgi:hypothetical protein